jgi:hypothetical protein
MLGRTAAIRVGAPTATSTPDQRGSVAVLIMATPNLLRHGPPRWRPRNFCCRRVENMWITKMARYSQQVSRGASGVDPGGAAPPDDEVLGQDRG